MHDLQLPRLNRPGISQTVFVFDRSLQNIGHDFHIVVRMAGKTLSLSNPILIDNS
ncbi:hypothetical protein D3C87_1846620 [compost metagenome]